jgi:virulence-associated protein VagC
MAKEDMMRAKVTEQGIIIPKELLAGFEEVEILKEENRIVITPLAKGDPIFDLGKHPVACRAPDASANHDKYLYSSDS